MHANMIRTSTEQLECAFWELVSSVAMILVRFCRRARQIFLIKTLTDSLEESTTTGIVQYCRPQDSTREFQ